MPRNGIARNKRLLWRHVEICVPVIQYHSVGLHANPQAAVSKGSVWYLLLISMTGLKIDDMTCNMSTNRVELNVAGEHSSLTTVEFKKHAQVSKILGCWGS